MIAIVDVTGIYKFGFGSRSAAIGSLTRGASTIRLSKIVSYSTNNIVFDKYNVTNTYKFTAIRIAKNGSTNAKYSVNLRFQHSFVKTARLNTSYSRTEKNKVTYLKPVTIFNNDAKTKIYKYAGLRIAKNGSTVAKYALGLRFRHSFLKPAIVFNNDAKTKIYKYAGLRTPKVFSIFNKSVLRFDMGSITKLPFVSYYKYSTLNVPIDKVGFYGISVSKAFTTKFYRDTEIFKIFSIKAMPIVSIKSLQEVFGAASPITLPQMLFTIPDTTTLLRFDVGSIISLPKTISGKYKSIEYELNKILFSGINTNILTGIKFYLNTELFKTTTIKREALLTFTSGQFVFGEISPITVSKLYTLTDDKFTSIFNNGSGFNSSFISSILAKDIIADYKTMKCVGIRISRIYATYPTSWQQNVGTGDGDTGEPIVTTEILIQFWS